MCGFAVKKSEKRAILQEKRRKNVRNSLEKVGKMCYHTRKDKKEGGRCHPLFFVGDLLQQRILTAINFGIQTAFFEECLVRSRFDHFSVVDHKNDVCVNYS